MVAYVPAVVVVLIPRPPVAVLGSMGRVPVANVPSVVVVITGRPAVVEEGRTSVGVGRTGRTASPKAPSREVVTTALLAPATLPLGSMGRDVREKAPSVVVVVTAWFSESDSWNVGMS